MCLLIFFENLLNFIFKKSDRTFVEINLISKILLSISLQISGKEDADIILRIIMQKL